MQDFFTKFCTNCEWLNKKEPGLKPGSKVVYDTNRSNKVIILQMAENIHKYT